MTPGALAYWIQVGRVLGIRDRDMPQTIEEFWPYCGHREARWRAVR